MQNMKKSLSETFKELGIQFTFPISIKNNQGKETYYENSRGYWTRREYNEIDNITYYEDSDGYWYRYEYDEKSGKETHFENSRGYWSRREYDECGKVTYLKDSDGYWFRKEYDEKSGKETYFEDSDGTIFGTPRKSCADGKVVVVDGQKYKLTAL